MSAHHFTIETDQAGVRLDKFLATALPQFSRVRLKTLIDSGDVRLNGSAARASVKLREADVVSLDEPAPQPVAHLEAEDIPLDILHEDVGLIVLNKPAGMVVHPGAGNATGTLVQALMHHCGSLSVIGGEERPGIVHRLDKETSGCLVVAKRDDVHRELVRQFAAREVEKTYLAVTRGNPRLVHGTIDAPIGRHSIHRHKMAIAERGRPAQTHYHVRARTDQYALVECRPLTGRTHQIRVHLKSLTCPILGDPVYGLRQNFTRHYLHAWKISFTHPLTQQRLSCESPVPPEFREIMQIADAAQMTKILTPKR